jgi:hypothetical protein
MGRQARLRPEYADWYPHVPPGQWQSAGAVRRIVLRQLRRGSPYWQGTPRVLSDEHFDFQGGAPRSVPQARDVDRRVAAHVPLRSSSTSARAAAGSGPSVATP